MGHDTRSRNDRVSVPSGIRHNVYSLLLQGFMIRVIRVLDRAVFSEIELDSDECPEFEERIEFLGRGYRLEEVLRFPPDGTLELMGIDPGGGYHAICYYTAIKKG